MADSETRDPALSNDAAGAARRFDALSGRSSATHPRISMRQFSLALLAAAAGDTSLQPAGYCRSDFDWEGWLETVRREKLGGLFGYWCLADPGFAGIFPQPIRVRLTRIYHATAACNLRCMAEVAAIIVRLQEAKIRVLVLKGVYLAEAIYPSPGCRPFGDADLLICPGDYFKAAAILEDIGYHAISSPDAAGPLSVSAALNAAIWNHKEPTRPWLHLHWHPMNSGQPFGLVTAVDDERLWADAGDFDLAGIAARGPAPHHLLLHLAEHAVKHVYDRLILLADLAAVIRRHGKTLRWATLLADARAFSMLSSVSIALRLAHRYAAANVPSAVLRELCQVRLTAPERRLVSGIETRRAGPLWAYLIYASRCGTWADRARFLRLTLQPESSRLGLQLGGSVRWRGYFGSSLRQLVRSLRG